MAQCTFKRELKAVVSKKIVNDIAGMVEDIIIDLGPDWDSESQRLSAVQIIQDFVEEVGNDGQILQQKVICDRRNNKASDIDTGKYNLAITFKQKNCLVTTQLLYTVTLDRSRSNKKKSADWTI